MWAAGALRPAARRALPAAAPFPGGALRPPPLCPPHPLALPAAAEARRGGRNAARSWQVRTLAGTAPVAGTPPEATVLAMAPGGRMLAAGYSDGSARPPCIPSSILPSHPTMKKSLFLFFHQLRHAPAHNPPRPPQVRLWNTARGESDVTLSGHKAAVSALRFSSSGALLASGGRDTDAIVWDVVAESGLFRLKGHHDQVTDCVFLERAGGQLVTASKDGFVRVWDLATQHCSQTLARARARATRRNPPPALPLCARARSLAQCPRCPPPSARVRSSRPADGPPLRGVGAGRVARRTARRDRRCGWTAPRLCRPAGTSARR